jgi:hypothetical protein
VRLSRRSDRAGGCGGLEEMELEGGVLGLNEVRNWEKRGPDRGCDASETVSINNDACMESTKSPLLMPARLALVVEN